MSTLFNAFCDIVDTDNTINGVKVIRDLDIELCSAVDNIDGYFANWLFYNIDSEKSPYIMVLYVPNHLDSDIQFKVFGAKYETRHNGFDDWEAGINMVMNG